MQFRDERHKIKYETLMSLMKRNDAYHRAVAYLMALADLTPRDVFDFEKDIILQKGIFAGWQTSSSRRATRLMFNLWNGWAYDEETAEKEDPQLSEAYAVDNIFCDCEYAPFFYEAIRIRFEWI